MNAYHEASQLAKLDAITLRVGSGAPISLLSEPTELAFEDWVPHAQSASLEIPLGDRLIFSEQQKITVEVKFRLPENDAKHTLTTVFVGKRKAQKRSRLWMFLNGG